VAAAQSHAPVPVGPGGIFSYPNERPHTFCHALAPTPEGINSCWSPEVDSTPIDGSWLKLDVTPQFTRVYVNGRYTGTAEHFAAPYRGVFIGLGPQLIELYAPGYKRQMFWVTQYQNSVSTLSRTLTPTKNSNKKTPQPATP
jgi:hypothetical protein